MYAPNTGSRGNIKTKLGNAADYANVTAVLKFIVEEEFEQFTILINETVINMKIPKEWNEGIILPMYRHCKIYRKIS